MYLPFDEGFYAKINKTDTCWIFTGTKNKQGYGTYRGYRAHRVAFILAYKHISKGKIICHRCDNPSCVRPDHLFEGTYSDNSRDAYYKGRLNIANIGNHGHWSYVNRVLSEKDIINIRNLYKSGIKQITLTKIYGVSRSCMSLIINNKKYKNI